MNAGAPGAGEGEEKVDHETVRKMVNELSSLTNVPFALGVVKKSGHEKIKDIPEDKLASFATILESEIAKAKEGKAAA